MIGMIIPILNSVPIFLNQIKHQSSSKESAYLGQPAIFYGGIVPFSYNSLAEIKPFQVCSIFPMYAVKLNLSLGINEPVLGTGG